VPYLVGLTALLGLPPFSLFFSEVAIVVAGVQHQMAWVMAIAVALLLVLFAGLARASAAMLFGAPTADGPAAAASPAPPDLSAPDRLAPDRQAPDRLAPDRQSHGPRLPLLLALGTTAVIGFAAGPFATLLLQAASVLGGTP
jgi:hydrogenase-4 component F